MITRAIKNNMSMSGIRSMISSSSSMIRNLIGGTARSMDTGIGVGVAERLAKNRARIAIGHDSRSCVRSIAAILAVMGMCGLGVRKRS